MADRTSYERSSTEIPTSPVGARGFSPEAGSSAGDREALRLPNDDSPSTYDNVVKSEIGVNTLLARLKQSIASARDFAAFLKKRSSIEEEHAQAIKKLCRSAIESARRPDNRQGSFSRNYGDLSNIYDRMADNGIQFALSLHQMHEDLQELAADKERKRKEWKQKGLSAEKRVQDAEGAMDKAKGKYNSLAEDYDRARTGDKQSGRFGLKGPKSAAQVEEDLHRKMQAADSDYSSKVQTAQSLQQELVNSLRPQAVQALEQLIGECDSGLTLQMQKFATFNEKLLLSNGLCISPVRGPDSLPQTRSLRDVVSDIDNDKDLKAYVSGFAFKVGPKHTDARYEAHPTVQPSQSAPQQQNPAQVGMLPGNVQHLPNSSTNQMPAQIQNPVYANGTPQSTYPHDSAQPPFLTPQGSGPSQAPEAYRHQAGQHTISNNPPLQHPSQQLSSSPLAATEVSSSLPMYPQSPQGQLTSHGIEQMAPSKQQGLEDFENPPLKLVFGVSLDELFARDGSAVPMVVYQCLQAVDLFGLDVEGIYRLSGNTSHVTRLRSLFDHDSSVVDFRNPENFFHDVNSVAGLLKQFFRELSDPLLTREHYQAFIDAARIDDDIARRDSLHAEINNLPDPNYATLRALTLHLHRVQEHSNNNRMNAGNLAMCFGPTLMVGGGIPAIADAGWQVRAIDTILQNAFSIFDED